MIANTVVVVKYWQRYFLGDILAALSHFKVEKIGKRPRQVEERFEAELEQARKQLKTQFGREVGWTPY